jgi:hypothetical protein
MQQSRLSIDHSQFTNKRLMVTIRQPKATASIGTTPHVFLEAEDGSGLAIAMFGEDSPIARADAAWMMALWNESLPHGAALKTSTCGMQHSGTKPPEERQP